jgi:hypothetical protein
LDHITSQTGKPPFDPRQAVKKFAEVLRSYHISVVEGDRFAGETFRRDFEREHISYRVCQKTKHQLYEALEPIINAGEIQLLDVPKLYEQILGLVVKGIKIDHQSGEHDDFSNSLAGVANMLTARRRKVGTLRPKRPTVRKKPRRALRDTGARPYRPGPMPAIPWNRQ